MSLQFAIESWDHADHDDPEICATVGSLRIDVDGHCLSRNEEEWSQTVKQSTRISAYPFALWLAASWWRLRFEPLPSGNRAPVSWRMAHEISASGYGYLWPQVVFACDGENMQLWSVPTRADNAQPIRYLSDRRETIPIGSFVGAVDTFLGLVLDRLDAVGLHTTDLRGLWSEVQEEREDDETANYRRIEAMLGFDPDEISAGVINRFIGLGGAIGSSALTEIASACSSEDPTEQLSRICDVADMQGIKGKFALARDMSAPIQVSQPPWVRGQELAHVVRDTIGADGARISDAELAAIAELNEGQAFQDHAATDRLPVGIAVREDDTEVKFVLRKRNRTGRRFELARLVCDHLLSDSEDRWLPATDTKTIRQKWQRAFAAEFLCPIASLMGRIESDFSDDSLEEAAEYFGVSERTVTSQLVNHGHMPVYALDERPPVGGFPYVI